MAHILKNNHLELHIDAPTENYSCTRFDWTGKISQLKFQNIPLTTIENTDLINTACFGKGFYNEFGIDTPLGFHETAIGGWFHKIGIGLLKKENEQYLFHKKYAVKPAKFSVSTEANAVIIHCTSEAFNGYSYKLTKEIKLYSSSFTVKYTLHNTGEKEIVTDEYVHNFMATDNALKGKEYALEFPFKLEPPLFDETVNTEQKVTIGSNRITFKETPKEQFFFSNLSGGKLENAAWTLLNSNTKIGIQETGNFQTNKMNVWGWGHVISPELFFKINIKAGKALEWTRTFEVFKINS
ncbi:hypothetical protein N9Q96_02315 [Flavobacteriaceae bacterium]|jgi:hypothetical protein|nr:hypothetical protein [Flavobacteriaceae bacterium]MDC1316223.1 hypothetical protein [bacterium]MDB4025649.1 hypothetical protein [Flavobacteriaceae bacterium]MDB4228164.1 hypothetical protein [Flavobacteriaceae bacterium]MDG1509714.1 hypothetical protein [Flavobacteriaceae bacterium]